MPCANAFCRPASVFTLVEMCDSSGVWRRSTVFCSAEDANRMCRERIRADKDVVVVHARQGSGERWQWRCWKGGCRGILSVYEDGIFVAEILSFKPDGFVRGFPVRLGGFGF
jgi:hypothetical protein